LNLQPAFWRRCSDQLSKPFLSRPPPSTDPWRTGFITPGSAESTARTVCHCNLHWSTAVFVPRTRIRGCVCHHEGMQAPKLPLSQPADRHGSRRLTSGFHAFAVRTPPSAGGRQGEASRRGRPVIGSAPVNRLPTPRGDRGGGAGRRQRPPQPPLHASGRPARAARGGGGQGRRDSDTRSRQPGAGSPTAASSRVPAFRDPARPRRRVILPARTGPPTGAITLAAVSRCRSPRTSGRLPGHVEQLEAARHARTKGLCRSPSNRPAPSTRAGPRRSAVGAGARLWVVTDGSTAPGLRRRAGALAAGAGAGGWPTPPSWSTAVARPTRYRLAGGLEISRPMSPRPPPTSSRT